MKRILSILLTSALLFTSSGVNSIEYKEKSIQSILENMTLEEKLGQMMLMDFRQWKKHNESGLQNLEEMNSEVGNIISKYHFGGVILFSSNLKNTEKSVKLIDGIQKSAVNSGNIPLLISTDQEGGIVTRLGQGTCMPGNMALGATKNTTYAYETGRIIGEELKAIGINCNHAPCIDINNNPKNPVIGLRSFGDKASLVSEMGFHVMQGLHSENVISTAKHFPGHGNTSSDSHTGLPSIDKTLSELYSKELIPFKYLIDNGIDMIMSAHIQLPKIDSTKCISKKDGKQIYIPATLSHKILTEILRNQMGFDGVIITDAMDMKAISDNFGETQAVKMAIKAGADIICMPTCVRSLSDEYKIQNLYSSIKSAVDSGEITVSQIDTSVLRILKLKQKYGILDKNYNEDISEKIKRALEIVGSAEHHLIEKNIALDAVTVIKGEKYLPVKMHENQTLLVFVPFNNEKPNVMHCVKNLINEKVLPNVKLEVVCYNKISSINNNYRNKISKSDKVIVLTEMCGTNSFNKNHWLTSFPTSILNYSKIKKNSSKIAYISIGTPYDILNYQSAEVLMAAYGYVGMDPSDSNLNIPKNKFGPNISAAIAKYFSFSKNNAELPIRLS